MGGERPVFLFLKESTLYLNTEEASPDKATVPLCLKLAGALLPLSQGSGP